ncbi:hypothetical protein HanIR_Chr10g0489351 [Helianthus annuus]|nr:hypothetical protein HanIR_Chr10g0489351 [Helianthus annuus]
MKRITCFISRNFPTMKKHVIPSSTTPLGINNKHPMKRKHRHKKHAAKHLFFNKVVSYLLSDSHMYNPLVSPQPSFDFPPPKHMFTSSSGGVQDDVVMPVKEKNKKLIEKVVDFLEADCYLYSPLVTNEHVCYKSTHGGNINSGGQMQKENTVGEGGDLRSQLRARAVVKKTVAYGESVKHMVH